MKKTLLVSLLLIFGLILVYLNHPVLQFGFFGFPIIILILLGIYFFISLGLSVDSTGKKFIISTRPRKWLLISMLLVVLYITIVPLVTTATIFHTSSYQKMIGEVKTVKKSPHTLRQFLWTKFEWSIKIWRTC